MNIRSLLILFLTLSASSVLFSQTQPAEHAFSLGLVGGLNSSKVSFTPGVNESNFFGPEYGVAARFLSEKSAGVLVEVNFTHKGWREKLDGASTYSRRLTTIEIPMLSTFMIPFDAHSFINITLGPQFDFIIGDKESQNLVDMDPKVEYGMSLYNKTLFTLAFGVQYERPTRIGSFIVDFRYGYTFVDLFPNHATDDFSKSQLNVMRGSIIYLIPWDLLFKSRK